MTPIIIPTQEQVPLGSRKYFDYFISRLGAMPNLYAVMAYSEPGLSTYLQLQRRKKLLTRLEVEAVSLVVSSFHRAKYCLANHTMIAKLNGLNGEQIVELCGGTASFDPKLDALARLVHHILMTGARVEQRVLDHFFKAGYDVSQFLEVSITIGDNVISNIISNAMHLPTDSAS